MKPEEAIDRAKAKLKRGETIDEFDVASLVFSVASTAICEGRREGYETVQRFTAGAISEIDNG